MLLGAFVVYRLTARLAGDLGPPELASAIGFAWLAIVIYTWVGPALFQRALDKELAQVKLSDDF